MSGFQRRARTRTAAGVVAVFIGLAVLSFGPLGTAEASAVPTGPDATTTTTVTTTTTTAPPETTTQPVTTTTLPSTTTTHPERTTTTHPSTTTTTTPSSKTSSSTPWGLIGLIVVLVIAVVLVALLLRSRRMKGIETEWRRTVVPALSDAQLARESLLSGNASSDDPQVRGAVEVQVEKAAVALERAVPVAPDPSAGSLASSAAGALRGMAFAIEADRLLRHGTSAPSGTQLAQADEARRARSSELNTALARLSTRIGSAAGPGSR